MNLANILASLTFVTCPTCGEQVPDTSQGHPEMAAVRCGGCIRRADQAREVAEAIARAHASIPAMYRWASFEAPELVARVPSMRRLDLSRVVNRGRITITGPAGSGKTSLAVAILRARGAESNIPGIFVHAYRLGVARIQARPGQGEAPLVEEAMLAKLALLDDIGNERQTANNAVPDVVFERHAEKLPTIVTTGLDAEGVAKVYGDGIARRVFEGAAVVHLGGGT